MFLLSPWQRILAWRSFRNSLSDYDESTQLQRICEFWAQVPLQTFVLDWDQEPSWPSAWQLIHEGNFDSIAVSILMEQTLILSGWNPERLKLMYVKDIKREDQMMILLIDDRLALNYSYKEVFDFTKVKDNCIALVKYQFRNGKRIEI